MEQARANKSHTWAVLAILVGVLASAPASAAGPPEGCASYAYASDAMGTIHTLMMNDSIMFGERVNVVNGCEGPVQIYADGRFIAAVNETGWFPISSGISTYRFIWEDGSSLVFENVTSYSSRVWEGSFYEIEPTLNPDMIALQKSDLQTREVMVSIGSAVIVWAMVTMLFWRLVNHYIDRNFVEEVIA